MRNVERDLRFDKIMSLYNEGILSEHAKNEALKELAYKAQREELYGEPEDEYLVYCSEIPAELNYEQRAEYVMEMNYLGYHFL